MYTDSLSAGWGMAAMMGLLASPLIVHKAYKRIYEDAFAEAHGQGAGSGGFAALPRSQKIAAVVWLSLIAVLLVVMIGFSVWIARLSSELVNAIW